MERSALFVDLPNFYSHLVRSGIADPESLRDYFLSWLDLDRLAHKLTGEFSPVWVFHSRRRIGPSEARVEGEWLNRYIERINALRGVTAYDVDIEGKQREHARYECEECGHEGIAQWESEKGIDASLTVRLFDTMDTWDVAYLLSGDADFVPAVRSLRRRGKTVMGAGFAERASALVRECYEYLDLGGMFVAEDVGAYELFRVGGLAARWLTDVVSSGPGVGAGSGSVKLRVAWQRHEEGRATDIDDWPYVVRIREPGASYGAYLRARGPIDLSSRDEVVGEFGARFPRCVSVINLVQGRYDFVMSGHAWGGVQRRLEELAESVGGEWLPGGASTFGNLALEYEYDGSAEEYVVVQRDGS